MGDKIINKYLKYTRNFVVLFLWIALSIQLMFLFASSYQITIPSYITNKLLSRVIDHNDKLKISNAHVIDFNKIKIDDLSWEENSSKIKARDIQLEVVYDPARFQNGLNMTVGDLTVERNGTLLKAENSRIKYHQKQINIITQIATGQKRLHAHIFVDMVKLPPSPKNQKFNLANALNYMDKFFQFCSDSNFYLYGQFTDKVELHASSFNNLSEKSNNVAHLLYQSASDLSKKISLQLHSKTNKFSASNYTFSSDGLLVNFDVNLDKQNHLSGINKSKLSFNSITLHGPISGEIPGILFSAHSSKKDQTIFNIFSDSNDQKISLAIEKGEVPRFSGFFKLNPNSLKLFADMSYGKTKIIDGNKLNIIFRDNDVSKENEGIGNFNVAADNFSALETPPGNFIFNGNINPEFSIFINSAYGKFGASEAFGKYEQHWNPLKYKFTLEGNCLPTDINPWLGLWWSRIWDDFSFGRESPYGKFTISGIWGGPSGNCLTSGLIRGKDIVYRDLKFTDSSLNILVKDSFTTVHCENLTHSTGDLSGSLIFSPKTHSNPHFEFKLKGQYPLNEGRGIFDSQTKKVLQDINCSVVDIEGEGAVFYDTPSITEDDNQTHFSLSLNSNDEIKYKNIPIQSFSGNVSRKEGLLTIDLPSLSIANGQGTLLAKEVSKTSQLVQTNLKLESASFAELSNIFEPLTLDASSPAEVDLSSSSFKRNGLVNLNFSGIGPSDNPNQFEGTGAISLNDLDVGRINILGGIRKNLGRFNLPLPSDALRFNSLFIPYRVENESLLFDNFELAGPISRISGAGTCDINSQTVEIDADFQLLGGVNIPVIKQIISIADPITKLSQIKISGPFSNPDWEIQISPLKQNNE